MEQRDRLISLYENLLSVVADKEGFYPETVLTAFAPAIGRNYSNELMVVGRSVNGWVNKWTPSEIADLKNGKKLIQELFSHADNCPLQWVQDLWGNPDKEEYNTKRSAFWRVIREVTYGLGIVGAEKDMWSSSFAWNNLYKIAPYNGGNPSSKLMTAQQEICIELLKEEVLTWKPKKILFLTGLWWAKPFLDGLGDFQETQGASGYIELAGDLTCRGLNNRISIVVVPHPQGKSEGELVQQVNKLFVSY